MSHLRLWTSAAIIAVIIVVSFMLSVPHTSEVPRPPAPENAAPAVPAITLHDSYKKGVHTITGSLIAPNPCTVATAAASLVGASSTPSILVAVTLPEDTGVCLEEPARTTFSATISAKAGLPLHATVNGLAATTTSS
jgi:hypothetical protein